MTDRNLLDIARGVAAMAQPGEQVEAYVLRTRDTDVKVFDGAVESLSVAEVDGVGVRLLLDHRQGYAWAGSLDPDDIIRQTPNGLYCVALGGGQVNTATGDFVFGMTEAYLIENGQITDPLREGNLIGNGPEVLTMIDAVGNDFAMGPPGMCGKDGQGVPVGDGVPTLRVTALTIGGTAA